MPTNHGIEGREPCRTKSSTQLAVKTGEAGRRGGERVSSWPGRSPRLGPSPTASQSARLPCLYQLASASESKPATASEGLKDKQRLPTILTPTRQQAFQTGTSTRYADREGRRLLRQGHGECFQVGEEVRGSRHTCETWNPAGEERSCPRTGSSEQ